MEKPPTQCWGVEAVIEPLPGGYRNRAFRTLGLNRDLVFKTTRRKPNAIEWLLPVLVLAELSGFVVPRPIKSTNGRYIEQGWTCEPFLQGRMFRNDDISQTAPRPQLFHENTRQIPQRPGFLAASDFIERDFGGDVDLRVMPADIVALCRGAWSRIASQPKSVIHGDLNPGNLIWTVDGGIGLLDWDEARVDATLFDDFQAGLSHSGNLDEFAVLAWEVASSWRLEPEYAGRMAAKLRQIATLP